MQHVVPLRESAEGLHFGNGDMRAGVVLVAIYATPILVAFIVLMLSISGVVAAIILAAVAIGVGLPIVVGSLVVPRASVLRSDGTLLQMPRFRKRYAESAGTPSFVRLRELETPEAKFFYVSLVLLCFKNQAIMRSSSTNLSRRRWTREWKGSRTT